MQEGGAAAPAIVAAVAVVAVVTVVADLEVAFLRRNFVVGARGGVDASPVIDLESIS
jgi:hypothetical protein